jgi:hypothetical protein
MALTGPSTLIAVNGPSADACPPERSAPSANGLFRFRDRCVIALNLHQNGKQSGNRTRIETRAALTPAAANREKGINRGAVCLMQR